MTDNDTTVVQPEPTAAPFKPATPTGQVRLADLSDEDRQTLMREFQQQQAEAARQQADEQGGRQGVSKLALAAAMARMDSDPPLYEVMVDQWGNGPDAMVRGTVFSPDDPSVAPYNVEWAWQQGVIRRLTMAEARSAAPSTTQALTADSLAIDEDLVEAGRFNGGFYPPEVSGVLSDPVSRQAVTVTTPSGPPEPPELAKPTIPYEGRNDPPARAVVEVQEGQTHAQAVDDHFAQLVREQRPAVRPGGTRPGLRPSQPARAPEPRGRRR